ncbi:MAG: START domain-containing protein [Ferruginibacter sp.]
MNWRFFLLSGCILILSVTKANCQEAWVLKLDKEGIKVYTKNLDNSPYKAVKTVCTIDASLSRITAVLLDIENCADWVYSTKKCVTLKKLSPAEIIYYSEIEIPWPVSNRDFIVLLKVSQDEKTKAVIVEGENRPTYLPENKNIVRIMRSYSKWVIEPMANGQVRVEYVLQVDPGGMVPSWLINMFATKGPFESFKNLRLQVKKTLYSQAVVPFIRD